MKVLVDRRGGGLKQRKEDACISFRCTRRERAARLCEGRA